jgi:hypothetical protein
MDNKILEANKLYEEGKFFEASFSYQEILKDISKENISKETKEVIKTRLKECILKSQNEYKQLSTEVKIDEDMLKQVDSINEQIIKEVNNCLDNLLPLSFSRNFICSFEDNENRARKTLPLTYQITNFSTHSETGYLLSNNEDYSPLELWSFQTYEMEQSMKSHFHIDPILKKLTDNKVLNSDSFMMLLENKGLGSSIAQTNILRRGIERYLVGDFISALHILVPCFENLILIISETKGMQTSAIERGKALTKRITLSDRDLKSEMISIFGKDFCFYLRYILYSPLGKSLRHKVAHGNLLAEECIERNCNLVLVSFFILLGKIK